MKLLLCKYVLLANLVLMVNGIYALYLKECTNTPLPLPTKALRYEFLTSKNETWKQEIMSKTHDHLTPTDENTWSDLFPITNLKEEDELSWKMLYKKIKYSNDKLRDSFLNEISLHNVRLDPQSLYGIAQQTNLEYLMILDVDSLVWSFRKTAGLPTPGNPYGGWEGPNVELRGHFVGQFFELVLFTFKECLFRVV